MRAYLVCSVISHYHFDAMSTYGFLQYARLHKGGGVTKCSTNCKTMINVIVNGDTDRFSHYFL